MFHRTAVSASGDFESVVGTRGGATFCLGGWGVVGMDDEVEVAEEEEADVVVVVDEDVVDVLSSDDEEDDE